MFFPVFPQINSSQAHPSPTVQQSQACTSQLKPCASTTPSNLTDVKLDKSSNCSSGQMENGDKTSKTDIKFFCGICKEGFVTKVALIHHSSKHKIKTAVCQLCGVEIIKARLTIHMKRFHSERQFKCTECDARFHVKEDLTRHKYIHSPHAKPFLCEMCGAGFIQSYLLKDHCKKFHGIHN